MQYDQVDKGGAAGGGQLLALFVGLRPLGGLGGGSHVASQTHFYHIGKASFLQSSPPTGHSDIGTKLALGSRSDQGNHPLAGLDGIDHFHNVCLGSDGAERLSRYSSNLPSQASRATSSITRCLTSRMAASFVTMFFPLSMIEFYTKWPCVNGHFV